MTSGHRPHVTAGWILLGWLAGTVGAQAIPSEGQAISSASDRALEFTGFAHEMSTGEPLYTEKHVQHYEMERLVSSEVSYFDKEGVLFARKYLDFSQDPYAPSFLTENLRTGEMERGTRGVKGYTISYRENSKDKLKAKTLSKKEHMIADAGFDSYVRKALPQLLEGKNLSFDFLVPNRQDTLSVKARAEKPKLVHGRETVQIHFTFNYPLLRLLAPPLVVTYDVKTGELLEYQGVSNLADEKGNKYRVRIAYPEGQLGRQSAGAQPQ